MPAHRLIPVLMAVAFGAAGCAMGGSGDSPQSPLPPNPPDMAVVTKAAVGLFATLKLPGSGEISPLRPAHPSTLADWMFCLRSDADDLPRNYAVFWRNNAILNYRLAVQVDGCARDMFQPLGTP
jgi:hypothetical protein